MTFTEEFPTHSEHWLSIDGYKNYEVSWFGRVRNAKTERVLKPCISGSGYMVVGLCKNKKAKTHNVHKLVAREWVENPLEKRCVDHIDNDRTNNHHENLRWAIHAENGWSQKIRTNVSSIYKGVSIHKQTKKWQVTIASSGKQKHLGLFASEREAAEAYNAAAAEHHGEYAKLNEIKD